ncbi:MAG: cell wall metabolism sensor histidine kinase WalK [Anaerolineales bacterium]|nr:cell wall metabolism sensor histidine kinase WalK [Anaerolineales bacterium]MDW8162660.1 HAMP domain-containing sensor histidine kinase [Anaerolineales bacterium]
MRSITAKLILAFLLVGISGSLLVALILWQRTRSAFDQFVITREQEGLLSLLLFHYRQRGSWEGVEEAIQGLLEPSSSPRTPPGFWKRRRPFLLANAEGVILYSFDPGQVGRSLSQGELRRAIALEVNDKPVGWVVIAPLRPVPQPGSMEERFLRTVRSATVLSAFGAGVLALVLGSFLAFGLTRTLRELQRAALDIAHGKYGRQVDVRSKDELGELARAFNQMSLQLQRAVQARRQMTADIAHELRSPLTVIQGYTEALSDGKLEGNEEVYQILHQETQHLSRLVDDLRLLSLADAGELPLTLQPVDPRVLLERAQARFRVQAEHRQVRLVVEAQEPLPLIRVDSERAAQVLDNLIQNALRYTAADGTIWLRAAREGGQVVLQVSDNGSGIAEQDLPRVFDRFYRADSSRSQGGSGLGLAIAKSLVEVQGGSITVESAVGQGTTFRIAFPEEKTDE